MEGSKNGGRSTPRRLIQWSRRDMNEGLTWSSGYGCVKEGAHRRNGIGVEATGRGN